MPHHHRATIPFRQPSHWEPLFAHCAICLRRCKTNRMASLRARDCDIAFAAFACAALAIDKGRLSRAVSGQATEASEAGRKPECRTSICGRATARVFAWPARRSPSRRVGSAFHDELPGKLGCFPASGPPFGGSPAQTWPCHQHQASSGQGWRGGIPWGARGAVLFAPAARQSARLPARRTLQALRDVSAPGRRQPWMDGPVSTFANLTRPRML